ncbi:MAG TPA: hypothetical protein VMV57_03645 [Terracidiphilus sp.]|nr:hypothetical protein [Terracidiphilus sp.]
MSAMVMRGILVFLFFSGVAGAQAQGPVPAKPVPESAGSGAYNWFVRAGLTCGVGASESTAAVKPTVQCGGIAGIMPFLDLEVGVMGPQANRSQVSGYLSTNAVIPLMPPEKTKLVLPLVVGGYTRMFETGNALDYGLAFAHPLDSSHSLQFEVLDYWANANPAQHNIVFRVVWLVGVPD